MVVLREIDGEPCKKCQGQGSRAYSSTATWRGGVGGQAITSGICDSCWGSGEEKRPWLNLRVMHNQFEETFRNSERLRRAIEMVREERLAALESNEAQKAVGLGIALDYMRGTK